MRNWKGWLIGGKLIPFPIVLRELVFAITVYKIWRARNEVVFRFKSITAAGMLAAIVDEVQKAVLTWDKLAMTKHN